MAVQSVDGGAASSFYYSLGYLRHTVLISQEMFNYLDFYHILNYFFSFSKPAKQLAGLISMSHVMKCYTKNRRGLETLNGQWFLYSMSFFLNLRPNLHTLPLSSCFSSSHFLHCCSATERTGSIFKYLHQLLEFLTPNQVLKCLICASPILQLTAIHQDAGYTRRWLFLSRCFFPLWVWVFKGYGALTG